MRVANAAAGNVGPLRGPAGPIPEALIHTRDEVVLTSTGELLLPTPETP